MSAPSVYLSLPDWSIFKLRPDPHPEILPPPSGEHSLRSPWDISAETYNFWLQPAIPVTFALLYATIIISLNTLNRQTGNQPWRISKSKLFRLAVLAHNIFLMLYSAATCTALVRALQHTWPSYGGYEYKFAEAVDALCKIHGPRGLGDAAFYDAASSRWMIKNTAIHLGSNALPDSTDVGRLWNEGLAFWGWWFYLSKFYEVIDSFILVFKGKKSSTLQIYHHAGAMAAMWAGIRYMSPPIWMFVCVNSFIHTWMYGYYTASALGYRVPVWFKRTLTTCQIMQFVVGALFAAAHLFVSYSVPVSTPYYIFTNAASIASVATDTLPSSASSVLSAAAPTVSMELTSFLKKMAFRAAGQEGLAENVGSRPGAIEESVHIEAPKVLEPIREIRYRNEYQRVPCIDTTGESFAIWLNLIYLLPLTWLFLRFFVRSYTNRISKSANRQQKPITSRGRAVVEASKDAVKETDKAFEKVDDHAERAVKDIGEEVRKDLADLRRQLTSSNSKDRIHALEEQTKTMSDTAIHSLKQSVAQIASSESVEGKMKRAEQFIVENTKTQSKKVFVNGYSRANEAPDESKQFDEHREDREDIGENQSEDISLPEGEGRMDEVNHDRGSDQEEKMTEIQDESKERLDEEPAMHSISDTAVEDVDKENEDPRIARSSGNTQPGSMTTSQTVSDLDGSYADVVRADARSTKSIEEDDEGGS